MSAKPTKTLILIVDDSSDDRFLYCHVLKKLGLGESIVEVEDGEEAIEYLKRELAPDLVLLDLKMPIISGFEVLQWINGQPVLKTVKVVVMTSSVIESDREKAMGLGAKGYFTKSDYQEMRSFLTDLTARFIQGI